jgi:hypothetical protein
VTRLSFSSRSEDGQPDRLLAVVKQMLALRKRWGNEGRWSAEDLRALCHPPHQLQRLEWLNLDHMLTNLDGESLAELAHLSGLTLLLPSNFDPDAFPYLPRFPRLQELRIALWHHVEYEPGDLGMGLDLEPGESEEEWDWRFQAARDEKIAEVHEPLVQALAGCPALTELTVESGQCSGEFGSRLMRAVPRLRVLHLVESDVKSLAFLRDAPHLVELDLIRCNYVRSGHLVSLGAWAPQLERLCVAECAALQMDEAEQRLITPPDARLMPRLREFAYTPHERSAAQPYLDLMMFPDDQ